MSVSEIAVNQVIIHSNSVEQYLFSTGLGRYQIDLILRSKINQGLNPLKAMEQIKAYDSKEKAVGVSREMAIDYLLELSADLLIDDDLDGNEMIVLKSIGLRLGVPPFVLNTMISEIINATVLTYNMTNLSADYNELAEVGVE